MADRKYRYALLSRYKKLCKDNGRPVPILNLNVEQWSADALIESFGLEVCYDIMDYYFSISPSPTWSSFTYRAGDLLEAKIARQKDDAFRKDMREKAKRWLGE